MSNLRSRSEAQIYDRIMYPGPEPRVPVNMLNARDWDTLESKEQEIVELKLLSGLPAEALQLTYDGFKAIHQHLFEDVYEWAGKERTYTTGRNKDVPFAPPENIARWMEAQFDKLQSRNYLKSMSIATFAVDAAELVNEMNAAHPFIEGNGRTQRVWLRLVAEQAGYDLNLRTDDKVAWNHAAKVGFLACDLDPMRRLIEKRLSPQHERQARMELADEYRFSSRADSSDNPALHNAVALEAYTERKLHAQYPDDPIAVEQGVATAKNKIAAMIARGDAIDPPTVHKQKGGRGSEITDPVSNKDRDRDDGR